MFNDENIVAHFILLFNDENIVDPFILLPPLEYPGRGYTTEAEKRRVMTVNAHLLKDWHICMDKMATDLTTKRRNSVFSRQHHSAKILRKRSRTAKRNPMHNAGMDDQKDP